MKKNFYLSISLFFLFSASAFAKLTPSVSGNVLDAKKNPAAFVNVILMHSSLTLSMKSTRHAFPTAGE